MGRSFCPVKTRRELDLLHQSLAGVVEEEVRLVDEERELRLRQVAEPLRDWDAVPVAADEGGRPGGSS